MPDAVRAALVERLAADLNDRGSFSTTGFRLACTPAASNYGDGNGACAIYGRPSDALWDLATAAYDFLMRWRLGDEDGDWELVQALARFACSEACPAELHARLFGHWTERYREWAER